MEIEPLRTLAKKLWDNKDCTSITKKYLTEEIVKKYENVKTKHGSTLAHCIRNVAFNPKAICPRSGDLECYQVFEDYLDAIIKDYHKVEGNVIKHPECDFGNLESLPFGDLDPSGKYVVSTRVRVGRSVEGYAFPTTITKDKRLELEGKISGALKTLGGEHKGTYYPLTGMKPDVQKQLVEDHFLFKDDDSVLRDAGGYRDWPSGRGIFHNDSKTFLVWVVEEDHMRIISMQKGGNLKEVYMRLIKGIEHISKTLTFVKSSKYGYVTCCPSNLGTTMRASVHVKVPKLAAAKKLDEVCARYNLQARGFHGEHTESPEGIYDISNKRRLGLTEVQAAKEMADGVKEIISMESSM